MERQRETEMLAKLTEVRKEDRAIFLRTIPMFVTPKELFWCFVVAWVMFLCLVWIVE
jgi:hypothetical protein